MTDVLFSGKTSCHRNHLNTGLLACKLMILSMTILCLESLYIL